MFVALVLLFLLCESNAEYNKVLYRCSKSNDNITSLTFKPSVDKVDGRYTAELCSVKDLNVTEWTIDLSYYDNPKYCDGSGRLRRPDRLHSTNTLDIKDTTNCTHVCYSMNFDLIFNGCCGLKSTFKKGRVTDAPHDLYQIINNNITKEQFLRIKPHAVLINHDKDVSLDWYLGIPPTDYTVEICRKQNNTSECEWTEEVTHNCSVRLNTEVHCALAPPYGSYRAIFKHEAPWTAGVFNNHALVHYDFRHWAGSAPSVSSGSAAVWWWSGGAILCGAALLTAALLAAALLRRVMRERAKHKFAELNRQITTSDVEETRAVGPDNRPVLLLYAREGEHGQRAIAALKELVQKATGGQVYDLFSPEVTALCAGAPAGWLRGMLQRDDVRVLLLQTPATAALYHAQLCEREAGLRLQEPLLGRRAQYRSPLFGDTLLQLALRLLAETAHAHHAYNKYYLATYSDLQTDILKQVVPYRRYELPDAAAVLLQHLSRHAPADPLLLQAFTQAVRDMVLHVQDNPDYLMDELIIM